MDEELKKEFKDIKALLALIASLHGAGSKEIAQVLGVSIRTIQNMIPMKSIKKAI